MIEITKIDSDADIFETLKKGDLFQANGYTYMRLEHEMRHSFNPTGRYNAVNVASGTPIHFNLDDEVTLVKSAKLTVEI